MSDFYLTGEGDITLSSNRDIGLTDSVWREDAQQAYFRIMTDPGDFLLYPSMGVDMSKLYGMPQSLATAAYGKQILMAGLNLENAFAGKDIHINAAPTGPQTIRFDIYITSGSRQQLILSIQQSLGVN